MLTDKEKYIVEKLSYNPETGLVSWKSGPASYRAGSIAGNLRPDGYIDIRVDGRLIRAHRIAWFLHHGRWPIHQIDHMNGIRNDNRIENLRECTPRQNSQNSIKRTRSNGASYTSSLVGVSWSNRRNRWIAQMRINGPNTYLGSYKSEQEAYQAYLDAKIKHHEFQPIPRTENQ